MLLVLILAILFGLMVFILTPRIIKKYKTYQKRQLIKRRQMAFKKKMKELEIK